MRRITYLFALALGLGVSAESLAQTGFNGGGGGGFGGGGGGFGGGGTSFSGGGTSFSGGGTSFSGGGTTFSGGGTSFTGGGTSFSGGGMTVPGRTGAGGRPIGGAGGYSISPTNFLAASYGNPLYNGRPGSTNISPKAGGGFGQPSFGTVAGVTNVSRTTTGTGGRTGTATVGGGFSSGMTGGTISPITYATEVRFAAPPVSSARIQTELQGLIARTSAIRQPSTVRIEVEGGVVILRGRVASDDERRLVEGMVRLEPGVHDVRNELEVP